MVKDNCFNHKLFSVLHNFTLFFADNNEKDNKFKSIVDLDNLKSDYFLQKLFDSLKKNKSLNITKYNKNYKKD